MRWLLITLVSAWALALPSATIVRERVFRDNGTVWQDAAVKAPMKPRPWINIAADMTDHRPLSATDREAAELALLKGFSSLPIAHLSDERKRGLGTQIAVQVGTLEAQLGREVSAREWYMHAAELDPNIVQKIFQVQ